MQNNYIPAPLSIFEGIHKLEPSVIARFDMNGQSRLSKYWSLKEIVRNGENSTFLDVYHAEETVSSVLTDAVQRQMVSDVPIGALLSGGIDSAVTGALAVAALGNENVMGVSMPSQYSSQGSLEGKWRKQFSIDNFVSLNFAAYDLLVIIERYFIISKDDQKIF